MSRLKLHESVVKDRTHGCCNIRGRLVLRGERPNKLRSSWFSPKSIEVEHFLIISYGVEHFMGVGGVKLYHFQENSEYVQIEKEDRLWAQRCRAKRETAQTIS